MSDPLILSVIIICHNQQDYIKAAVDSALAQETNFPFEVIVSDDGSTDNTRQILNSYADHPQIRLIFNDPALGPNPNFLAAIAQSKARYFANLEGDDYWVDVNKLQKQVDVFEKNPNVTCVATNAYFKYDNSVQLYESYVSRGLEEFSAADLISQPLGHTCTVVYKSELAASLPILDLQPYDFLMHILYAKKGQVMRLPDYTSVYRVHDDSLWSAHSSAVKLRKMQDLQDYLQTQNLLKSKEEKKAWAYRKLKPDIDKYWRAFWFDKAVWELEQFDKEQSLFPAQYHLCNMYMGLHRWPQFRATLYRLRDERPDDPDLDFFEARFLQQIQRFKDLQRFTEAKIEQYPDHFGLHHFHLKAVTQLGTHQDINDRTAQLISRFESAPPLQTRLGQAVREAGTAADRKKAAS